MIIIIPFIPWILFWVMLAMRMPEAAALISGAFVLIIIISDIKRKKQVKRFQVMMLTFFAAVSIAALFFDLETNWIWVRVSSCLFFAALALLTIVVKKPFTLECARGMVPKEKADTPEFTRVNYVVSWTWFFVFIAYLIVPALRLSGFEVPKTVGALFAISIAVAAVKFSLWYMHRALKL